MKIYHGSESGDLTELERRQANVGEHLPEYETRDAIYLTTDFSFALLAAGRPKGPKLEGGGVIVTQSDGLKQVTFNDPSKFEPEKEVYIYEWNLDELPEGSYEIHGHQVVLDTDALSTHEPVVHFAREIFEYYEATNWSPEPVEYTNELKFR